MFVLSLTAGGLVGAFGMSYALDMSSNLPSHWILLLLLLEMYVAAYIQIIIHEAGHLLFGKLSGYRFASFRVFGLMLVKENDRIKAKRYSLKGTGGQCLMLPPSDDWEHMPVLLYNLGGSLLNIISVGVFFGLFLLTKTHLVSGLFFLCLIVVGALYALTNGVPLNTGTVVNDGHNAFHLGKDKGDRRAFWIQLQMVGGLSQGLRLKDMPDTWFTLLPDQNAASPLSASIEVFACNRSLDKLDLEETKTGINSLLKSSKGLLGLHRSYLMSDLIFCHLVTDRDRAEIDRLSTKDIKKYLRATLGSPATLRTIYAYDLLYKGDEAAAAKRLKQFEKVAKRHPYPCEIESERELLELIEHKLEQ